MSRTETGMNLDQLQDAHKVVSDLFICAVIPRDMWNKLTDNIDHAIDMVTHSGHVGWVFSHENVREPRKRD